MFCRLIPTEIEAGSGRPPGGGVQGLSGQRPPQTSPEDLPELREIYLQSGVSSAHRGLQDSAFFKGLSGDSDIKGS